MMDMKISVVYLTILLALNVSRLCADGPFQSVPNVYLGAGGSYSAYLAGDFNGEEYYSSGDDFLLPVYLPEGGFGWEIEAGYQNEKGLSFEMGVSQTYHKAFWQAASDFEEIWILSPGEKIDARLSISIFYIDIKQNLLLGSRLQPYWRGGVGFSSASSDKGYVELNNNSKGGFSGVSMRAGLGLETFLTPQISLAVDCVYQFGMFSSAEWDGGSASIKPWLFVHEIKPGVRGVYRYSLNS